MAAKIAKTIAATSGAIKDLHIDLQEGAVPSPVTSQMRKTKYCSYFLQGACRFGSDCMYAHALEEIQTAPDLRKTQLCKAFEEGCCENADCNFAHGEHELRTDAFFKKSLCTWNEKGKCRNGSRCRFAHGIADLRSESVQTDYETALDDLLKGVPRMHNIKADAGDRHGPGGPILAPANMTPMPISDPMKVVLPRQSSPPQYHKVSEEAPKCKFFETTELASMLQANLDKKRLKTFQQIAPTRKSFETTEMASMQRTDNGMNQLKEFSNLRQQIALISSCCELLQDHVSQFRLQQAMIAPPPGLSQETRFGRCPRGKCSNIDLPASMIPELRQCLIMQQGGCRGIAESTWSC